MLEYFFSLQQVIHISWTQKHNLLVVGKNASAILINIIEYSQKTGTINTIITNIAVT